MILPSQLKLSNKQQPPSPAPHAVKHATAAHQGTTAAISNDKGIRARAVSTGMSATARMESLGLIPTTSTSSQDFHAQNGISWGPQAPILVPKNSPHKKLSRKASNPPPKTSAGGGASHPSNSTSHSTKSTSSSKPTSASKTTTPSKSNGALPMDRTFTRRPNSKESTTSSQRTAVSTTNSGTPLNGNTSNSTLTNSTSSTSSTGPNAPVQPNFLPSTASAEAMRRPFTMRHNRKYLSDPVSYYPLPFTLSEMHRQVLRSMLLVSVFGSPLCSPLWMAPNPPPKKILEVGCGNGYWSALCHKHFSRLGHVVEFTGIDIAPLASDMRAEGMQWRFVQHDLRSVPILFKDEEFDVIMVKDLALISSALNLTANLMEEYFRCLKPGGQMEVWDSDSTIRLLAPHSPSSSDALSTSSTLSESDDAAQAEGTGTYVITPQTPFRDAQNPYLVEYNSWITTALTKRGFTTMPCTLMGPLLAQEPQLNSVETRRIAIPFSPLRWEREDEAENGRLQNHPEGRWVLTDGQRALRETALNQFVMWIDSMEPFLKSAAEKNQEEWDRWYSDMMASLLSPESPGTAAGECLEIGAWWATKKGTPKVRKGNSAIAEARRRKEEAEHGKPAGAGGGGQDKPSPYPADPHPGKMWDFSEKGAPPL